MRRASDMPRRGRGGRLRIPGGRRRMVLIAVLVVVFVLATSLRGLASFYTDKLWFDSLDLGRVWWTTVRTKAALVIVFTLVFFLLLWTNLLVAERLSGRMVRFGGSSEDDLVLRYRELVGRRAGLVRGVTAGLIALAAGGGASSQWQSWILLRNHVEFGEQDATFGHDIGFYVFQLPFLRFALAWLFSALVVVTVATLVAHYLNGGIRLQATQDRVGAAVKAHVSVLLAALAAVRAAQYWFDRYELVYSQRGQVDGAGYTDINVQAPALELLVIISLFSTVLFLVNIRRKGWVLPALAVGTWALVAVLGGEAVPALVQRFRVDSRPSALEAPYVENNIAATRSAMGLDGVVEREFAYDYGLSGQDLIDNEETVRNIRLWDPAEIQRAFRVQQVLREYYDITDVDVDRYTVDGDVQQMMVGARNIDDSRLPEGSRGWERSRLVYTSGYGVVMAPANAKSPEGQPNFVVRNIPTESDPGYPEITQPALYFGEGLTGYKIVDTTRDEQLVDSDDGPTGYTGIDGVPLDGFLRRAAFSLRFWEIEPLTSGSIRPESRVLMQRDVRERVQELAPFLAYDADPYPVVIDGRVVYVIDAYTTTDRYPNAQRADTGPDLPSRSDLRGRRFNYIRNSVKAVVDAYDGTVRFYVTDESDPLVRAYRKAFPDLFAPLSEAPAGLEDHFRYPEDMFRAQTALWGRYHITEPDSFLNPEGQLWTVAAAPDDSDTTTSTTTTLPTSTTTTTVTSTAGGDDRDRVEPTYQLLRLPGEENEDFVLLRPFTVRNRAQLSAFLAATPDGGLASYSVAPGQGASGPAQVAAAIQGDQVIGQFRNQFRERLSFGNVLLVPIGESVLYVQSMYVTTDDQTTVRAVVVASQRGPDNIDVQVGSTLREALERLFGQAPETLEDEPSDDDQVEGLIDDEPGSEPEETPDTDESELTDAELIDAIQAEFDRADAALLAGEGLAQYQAHVDEARRLLDILASRHSGGAGPSSGGADEDGSDGGSDGAAGDGPEASGSTTPSSTTAPPATTVPSSTTVPAAPTTTAVPPTSTAPPAGDQSTTTTRPSA